MMDSPEYKVPYEISNSGSIVADDVYIHMEASQADI